MESFQQAQVPDISAFKADSIVPVKAPFIETTVFYHQEPPKNLYSKFRNIESIADWYFIIIVVLIGLVASAKIMYGKFLNSLWLAGYSYQIASKAYKERGIVQKRFDTVLDLIYLISFSLLIFLVIQFFSPQFVELKKIEFVIYILLILASMIIARFFFMRLTGYIFKRSEVFNAFLYHYFIYTKVLGLVIIPFLVAIPYTHGNLHKVLIFTAIGTVIAIQTLRLIRVLVYVVKNVVLFFYLILYLCILEILPILVLMKVLFSLAQV
jgi:hypothetical protein